MFHARTLHWDFMLSYFALTRHLMFYVTVDVTDRHENWYWILEYVEYLRVISFWCKSRFSDIDIAYCYMKIPQKDLNLLYLYRTWTQQQSSNGRWSWRSTSVTTTKPTPKQQSASSRPSPMNYYRAPPSPSSATRPASSKTYQTLTPSSKRY